MRVDIEPPVRRAAAVAGTSMNSAPPRKSFRDPAGAVWRTGDRILRTVHDINAPDLDACARRLLLRREHAMDSGPARFRSVKLTPSEFPETPPGNALYEHERVWFPSYPHEWPAELLHAAGQLTQGLCQAALNEGFGLKDATPYNVLFQGVSPTFVDVLSFERRDSRDATWLAYSQFVQTFLLPLLAYREFGLLPADLFLRRREGLDPEAALPLRPASRQRFSSERSSAS